MKERAHRVFAFLRRHQRKLIAGFVVAAGVVVLFLVFGWSTGFRERTSTQTTITRTYSDGVQTTVTETTEHGKTLWDWLDLLIVPAVLAGGAVLYNQQAAKREEVSREDRYREEALQKYFDEMSELLLEHGLREALEEWDSSGDVPPSPVVDVAQTRTVTVLSRVDEKRRDEVLRFLNSAELLAGPKGILRRAHLAEIDLTNAYLYKANLSKANLFKADLSGSFPIEADLRRATLNKAMLRGTFLTLANLSGASLEDADLSGANLEVATVLSSQLRKAKSLDGATMPNGQKYSPDILDEADRIGRWKK